MRSIYRDISATHMSPRTVVLRQGETAVRIYFRFASPFLTSTPTVKFYIEELFASAVVTSEEACYVDITGEMTQDIGEYRGNLHITDGSYTALSPTVILVVEEVA